MPLNDICRGIAPRASFRYMQVGYARVSTNDQTESFKFDALRAAGFELTFAN